MERRGKENKIGCRPPVVAGPRKHVDQLSGSLLPAVYSWCYDAPHGVFNL